LSGIRVLVPFEPWVRDFVIEDDDCTSGERPGLDIRLPDIREGTKPKKIGFPLA
jgi:hypothetical protein